MITLILGKKGSGKTKTLIELTNNAAQTSNGSVVCIEKGDKLKHEITYKARLIDTDAYGIVDATSLYGFVAGIATFLFTYFGERLTAAVEGEEDEADLK